jgi:hypothetical protein
MGTIAFRRKVWYLGSLLKCNESEKQNQLIDSNHNFSTVLRVFKPVDLRYKTIIKQRV